jgi:hypothetical protein
MTKAPRLIGHPADGSKPFVMAILDLGNAEDRAAKIWKETAHLYTQKLSHYTIEKA